IYSGAGDGADAATTSPTESAESSSQFHDAIRYVYTASPSFVGMARGTDGRLVLESEKQELNTSFFGLMTKEQQGIITGLKNLLGNPGSQSLPKSGRRFQNLRLVDEPLPCMQLVTAFKSCRYGTFVR
ncbi:hypothetical protein FRC18_008066, partial [Serendipita sp. 400]